LSFAHDALRTSSTDDRRIRIEDTLLFTDRVRELENECRLAKLSDCQLNPMVMVMPMPKPMSMSMVMVMMQNPARIRLQIKSVVVISCVAFPKIELGFFKLTPEVFQNTGNLILLNLII
jgi:hypothetical protein